MLDPSQPVWPGLLKAALYLLWLGAVGAPIAWTVFRQRRSGAWLLYAPAAGVAVHLLILNGVLWFLPGAAGTWTAMAAVSGLAVIAGRRSGVLHSLRQLNPIRCSGAGLLVGAFYMFALANRTQVLFADEPTHLPLAKMIARGFFPPVSPFTPDVAAAYHYGAHLIAADVINVAGTGAWTAFYVVSPFISTVLFITVIALVYDVGGSFLVGLGAGLMATFMSTAGESLLAGIPRVLDEGRGGEGFLGPILQFGVPLSAQPTDRYAPLWLNTPHFALGLAILLLLAAVLNAGRAKRHLALAGACLAILDLCEPTLFIVGFAAFALFGAVAMWRFPGKSRAYLFAAAALGLGYAVFAGGILTDVLFRGAGNYAAAGLAPDIDLSRLVPSVARAGPAAVLLSPALLLAVSLACAIALRSAGLGFLAGGAAAGLALQQVLSFEVAGASTAEDRLVYGPYLIGAIAAIAGISGLTSMMPAKAAWTAGIALLALVVTPSTLPRMVSAAEIAARGIDLGYPTVHDEGTDYLNPTRYAARLRSDWWVYDWMARALPRSARVLSPESALVSLTTGLAAPRSVPELAACCELAGPEYMDALRFLSADDRRRLGVTHLHVTSAAEALMDAQALRMLEDGLQFKPLAEFNTPGGRHRLYEILPEAGRSERPAGSFAELRHAAAGLTAVTVLGPVPEELRRSIVLLFAVRARIYLNPTFLPRIAANPDTRMPEGSVQAGLLILPEWLTPTAVGLDFMDSIWTGYGMRAYLVRSASDRNQVWRTGSEASALSEALMAECDRIGPTFALRIMGQRGDRLLVGEQSVIMAGVPQSIQVSSVSCRRLRMAWDGDTVAPFLRLAAANTSGMEGAALAGLAFDGDTDGHQVVVNLWYRNPDGIASSDGTELRVYQTDKARVSPTELARSAAWWPGPIVLSADTQMATLRFDAEKLEIEGTDGTGRGPLLDGDYQLALTVAGMRPGQGDLNIRQVIPLVLFSVRAGAVAYQPLGGIVGISP